MFQRRTLFSLLGALVLSAGAAFAQAANCPRSDCPRGGACQGQGRQCARNGQSMRRGGGAMRGGRMMRQRGCANATPNAAAPAPAPQANKK
jgi:hypothetical protein